MSKSAFAVIVAAFAFAVAGPAAAGTEYHLGKYADVPPGTAATLYAADHAHYLTYTGSTEQPGAVDAAQLRGKALNKAYGNEWTKMSAQQFAVLVNMFGTDVTQYSPKQLHALLTPGSASGGGGFGWADAGIGAVAAIGLMLVAGIVRRIRRTPRLATA